MLPTELYQSHNTLLYSLPLKHPQNAKHTHTKYAMISLKLQCTNETEDSRTPPVLPADSSVCQTICDVAEGSGNTVAEISNVGRCCTQSAGLHPLCPDHL